MKKAFLATSLFLCFILSGTSAQAQVPGSILSVALLGGVQKSNLDGVGGGTFLAIRGSFSNFFAEIRHSSWGNNNSYVHESGILAGADFAVWHLMISGAVGVGTSTYQSPAVLGTLPPTIDYRGLIFDAQALYQIEIVTGVATIGIGVNYVGELNTVAPISGIGAVAVVSLGI